MATVGCLPPNLRAMLQNYATGQHLHPSVASKVSKSLLEDPHCVEHITCETGTKSLQRKKGLGCQKEEAASLYDVAMEIGSNLL